MNSKEMILRGESDTLESKESTGEWKEIIKAISALANTKGGIIIVGINKKSKVSAIQIGKRTSEDLANKIKESTDPKIFPEISVENMNRKDVILIKIKESKFKPVFAFDWA